MTVGELVWTQAGGENGTPVSCAVLIAGDDRAIRESPARAPEPEGYDVAGVDDLPEPFEPDDLLARLQALLRRAA